MASMNYNEKVFILFLTLCSSFFLQSMDERSSGSGEFDILSYIPSNPWAESYRSGLVESKNLFLRSGVLKIIKKTTPNLLLGLLNYIRQKM